LTKLLSSYPDAQLLVASIPPINPNGQSLRHGFKRRFFNAAIPDIIHDKVAEGKKVNFVDMTSLTVKLFLAANG